MKMSRVPLRFTAKSWSWCIGRQSRLASAPSTIVVAVTSYASGASSVAGLRPSSHARCLPVAEAGVRLDADELVALVAVLDVDHPEPAGAELGGLLVADRPQDLAARDHVARTAPARGTRSCCRRSPPRAARSCSFRSKWTCSGSARSVAPGRPVMRPEPHREHRRRGDGPPVSSAATSSSQNSGLPFSTDAHVVQM